MPFLGMSIGSKYARKQRANALSQQTNAANALLSAAQQQQGVYNQYMPGVLNTLQMEAGRRPAYLDALAARQRSDISQGLQRGFGETLTTLNQRGILNSSALGGAVANLSRYGGEALARVAPEVEQQADARTQSFLQLLASLAGGAGSTAMGGYQGAGGAYGNVGEGWGEQEAAAMAPFSALMTLLGEGLGAYLGGNPAAPRTVGRGVNTAGRALGGGGQAVGGGQQSLPPQASTGLPRFNTSPGPTARPALDWRPQMTPWPPRFP